MGYYINLLFTKNW